MNLTKLAQSIRNYVTASEFIDPLEKVAGWEKTWLIRRLQQGRSVPAYREYNNVIQQLNSAGRGGAAPQGNWVTNMFRKLKSRVAPSTGERAAALRSKLEQQGRVGPSGLSPKLQRAEARYNSSAGNLPQAMLQTSLERGDHVGRFREQANQIMSQQEGIRGRMLKKVRGMPGVITGNQMLRGRDVKNSYFRGAYDGGYGFVGQQGVSGQGGIRPDTPVYVGGLPSVGFNYARAGGLLHVGDRSSLLKQYPALKFSPHLSATGTTMSPAERTRMAVRAATKGVGFHHPGWLGAIGAHNNPLFEAAVPYSNFMADPSRRAYRVLTNPNNPRRALLAEQGPQANAAVDYLTRNYTRLSNAHSAQQLRLVNRLNPLRGTGLGYHNVPPVGSRRDWSTGLTSMDPESVHFLRALRGE